MNVDNFDSLGYHGLEAEFPLGNALNTVNGKYPEMRDFLFELFC